MSDCYIVGDIFEQEDWFRVFFIQPPNGEDLHARNLIEYSWGLPTPPSPGQLNQYELVDNNREAHYIYSRVMAEGDPETDTYTIDVKARDLRFETLDISDTEQAQVDIDLPCVILGNSPNFSIADAHIYEPETGQQSIVFTITASEAVLGLPIEIDYCTEDVTASSTSETVEVKHVAYDKNVPPEPFISYLEFGNVRAVFDASFPKFYNSYVGAGSGREKAYELLTNFINWLNVKGGTKVLFMGDREDQPSYQVKDGPNTGTGGTAGNGFYNSIRPHIEGMGYTVDTLFKSEIGANPGNPTAAEMRAYDVIVYMSSHVGVTGDQVLSNAMVNSIENAVRSQTGILIITDHMDSAVPSRGFAVGGNQIANRFFAEFSGSINRAVGTDFDEVRATYGDHPLIAGVTGTMPGDGSEGKIETNNAVLIADYEQTCGTVTFNEGQASRTISVPVNADTIDEDVETFKMNISNATRGAITRATGIGTIDLPPTVITELVAEDNTTVNSLIALDHSGSTSAYSAGAFENPEVTTNGQLSTRRYLMEQIILDYELLTVNPQLTADLGLTNFANRDPVSLVSHNTTTVAFDDMFLAKDNNVFDATPGGALNVVVDAINNYMTGKTFTADDAVNIFIMTDAADGNGGIDPSTVWQNELASFPQTMKKVNLTIIRVCKSAFWTQTNYVAAETMFRTFIAEFEALNPAKFNGTFETFETYVTGADSELNRIINESFADEYTAYCNVNGIGSAISVYANSPEEAQALAEAQITCP